MAEINRAKMGEFMERVLGAAVGAASVQMAHLGDRLRLYDTLARTGAITAAELAGETGYAERYLAEWLAQQAAIGFVTYDRDSSRFALPAEHAMVLTAQDSPTGAAGLFEAIVGWQLDLDRVADAFRTGAGISWGDHDHRVYAGTERFFGAAYRTFLVSQWMPALGLDEVLRRGALVADVGCGHGICTALLAEAYPRSRFVGFDSHAPSIERARKRAAETRVAERVRYEVADAANFGGGPYDVVWFFDCLHDLGDPVAAAANARRNLAGGGTVALVEPFAHDDLADNIATNPGAGIGYAASTFLCVPHSLSEPGHATLGGLAGGKAIIDTLRAAGLTHTERVATTEMHAVYAARP